MVGYDHAGPDPSLVERLAGAARILDEIQPAIGGMGDAPGGSGDRDGPPDVAR